MTTCFDGELEKIIPQLSSNTSEQNLCLYLFSDLAVNCASLGMYDCMVSQILVKYVLRPLLLPDKIPLCVHTDCEHTYLVKDPDFTIHCWSWYTMAIVMEQNSFFLKY